MKTIKIKEEFQIPGTDVVLEKGDKIQVILKEMAISLDKEFGRATSNPDPETAGRRFAGPLMAAVDANYNGIDATEFFNGLVSQLPGF